MLLSHSSLVLKLAIVLSSGQKKINLSIDSSFRIFLFLSGQRNEGEFTTLAAQSCDWGHSCETAGRHHLASI